MRTVMRITVRMRKTRPRNNERLAGKAWEQGYNSSYPKSVRVMYFCRWSTSARWSSWSYAQEAVSMRSLTLLRMPLALTKHSSNNSYMMSVSAYFVHVYIRIWWNNCSFGVGLCMWWNNCSFGVGLCMWWNNCSFGVVCACGEITVVLV